MEAGFVIAAGSASIDQGTNQISIFSVIEDVGTASFPLAFSCFLCALLRKGSRENDTIDIRVQATLSGHPEPLVTSPGIPINFQGKQRARIVAQLSPIVIPEPGELVLSILVKNTVIGHWKIQVNKLSSPVNIGLDVATGATAGAKKVKGSAKRKKARKRG